jgi:Cellulase (glycosyl hydrolase family 5)
MVLVFPAALCLLLACAATPESDNWTSPPPESAPAGSPVALHGQLRVVTSLAAGSSGDPIVDAGEAVIDGGEPTIDGGEAAVDGGTVSIDVGKTVPDAGGSGMRSQLVDQNGAPFQLKGVSSQWLAWETRRFAESKSGLQYMRDHWKLSVIRASMGTEANGGYLSSPAAMKSQVESVIHNAIDLGVYVIVDWHTEQAVAQQDAAIAFFTEMAKKYGAYPNVIWETYNEPKGYAWVQIKPYHEAVVAAIRAVDPDNLIVLGTPNFSQRVDQAAADPVIGTNLLYTLHWYSCTHGQMFRDYGTTAIAKGIALFVTEYGATFSDGGLAGNGHDFVCEGESNRWFEWMQQNNISGVAWKLDQGSDSSAILGATAGIDGPWTDDRLSSNVGGEPYAGTFGGGVLGPATKGGHGLFIVNWLRQ